MFQDDYISVLSLITEDDAHNATINEDESLVQDTYEIETENLHFKFLLDKICGVWYNGNFGSRAPARDPSIKSPSDSPRGLGDYLSPQSSFLMGLCCR